MSEEEIKDIIEILELSKEEIESNNENITATLDLQDLKSLKSLYDLYTKEKDLNNELQIRYKIENDKYLEEKEKNKVLEIRANELNNLAEIVQRDYIHKDKIKEIIDKIDVEDYYCLNEAEEDLRKLVE